MRDSFSPSVIDAALGPRNRITEAARQEVLDAAAVLQVRRSEAASRAAGGDLTDIEVIGRGHVEVNQWMTEAAAGWRELLSVRPAGTVAQLNFSLPYNRTLLEGGLRMISIFAADGLDLDARMLLANEPVETYLLSVAPVQMKIVDRQTVLLQGPTLDGESTVMAVRSAACLDAAWRYWQKTQHCAFPAAEGARPIDALTRRQRQIASLMATGISDEAIASSIGVSVRTVRADIAGVLETLGVRTRFAAGVRLQLWTDNTTAPD